MKYLLKWWLVHALHWALLYGAFAAQIDGAMFVVKFWVWVMAPASLLLLADKTAIAAAKKPARPVLRSLSWLQAWATLGLLVWNGHIATGLAWGVVMAVIAVHQDATDKARASAAAVAA